MKQEFEALLEKLKAERDEMKLKMHLASMEVKDEFSEAEEKWDTIKRKANEIADDSVETTDDFIAAAKVVGEELKDAYQRIAKRLKD
ncbi:MAG: hypothetical protein IBX55_03855 [Methyloprofundus sp.]|nr:hypothetical protein [Methyloprofundus sp.]MBW6453166.1 hypothetical protein [Methyloprofundus sp.]